MAVAHLQAAARLVERPPSNSMSVVANEDTGFIENLPTFRDVPGAEKHNLFIKKLNICCYLFDFTDTDIHNWRVQWLVTYAAREMVLLLYGYLCFPFSDKQLQIQVADCRV